MARAAAAASKYEEMVVSRTKKKTGQGNQGKTTTKSVNGKVTSFSYYESVYSPATTANVTYVDSAESTCNGIVSAARLGQVGGACALDDALSDN